MVVITFENLISIPLEMAFHEFNNFSQQAFSIFCDFMFLLDIALNFRMGVLSNDSEVGLVSYRWFSHLSSLFTVSKHCLLLGIVEQQNVLFPHIADSTSSTQDGTGWGGCLCLSSENQDIG